MRIAGLVAGLLMVFVLSTAPTVRAADGDYKPHYDADGWEVLFDGKDLSAWDMKNKEYVWEVNPRGELYINSEGHTLYTKKRYCDFILEMDFKVVAHQWSNSGAFIHVHDRSHEVQTGYEIQILADADYDYKWDNIHATGALYDMVRPAVNACKPPGEWNHFRITAKDSLIDVELNGKAIVHADLKQWNKAHQNPDGSPNKFPYPMGALPREGFIGLQNHGGLPTWFRNIRVKALSDRKPRFTGNEPIEEVLQGAKASASAAAAWAEQTQAQIRRAFYMRPDRFYAENAGTDVRKRPAWLWDAGVELSALNAAAKLMPDTYLPQVRDYARALRAYRTEYHDLPGLDVNPPPKASDRYYDDNAWIVLSLLDAYDLTHDPEDLKLATDAYNFVMSGSDDVLGGGIYWHEDRKTSKNACSCGPALLGAIHLYQITQDPRHLATAKALFEWTQKRLQDSNGLIFDSIRVSDEKVNRAEFSYNSATMIRGAAMLYQITHEAGYLKEAQRIASASEKKWVSPSDGIFIGPGKFGHKLMEAFLEVYDCDHDSHWMALCSQCVKALHERRAPNGWYSQGWDEKPAKPIDPARLIDQSSAARAYWLLAGYGISFDN